MGNRDGIYLSFYGDDFTGSTDAMESLTLQGLPAALFLQPPSLEEVQKFKLKNKSFTSSGKLQAIGIAGVSRTMDPAGMSRELPEIFEKISHIPARFFHYKVCSTFDSSPHVGNIGHAVEIALTYFPSSYIPLLIGAPDLNRFCVFGNLFARAEGKTYRLDRNPTMSKHPVTPMSESDIRVHLGLQTKRKIHLLDILDLKEPYETSIAFIQNIFSQINPAYLLFDVLDHSHLKKVGKLLEQIPSEKTQLIVGSSGVENAITAHLQENKQISELNPPVSAGRADKVIIMAGSCSPGTQRQIEWAIKKGFEAIRIYTVKLADPQFKQEEINRVIQKANQALQNRSIILYTALGPEDEAILQTKQKLAETSITSNPLGEFLGKLQGFLLREIFKDHATARVVVAGGDTSGHVAMAMDIYALEILTSIAPGAPLCLAHSNNSLFDGIQIALKGGQNGNEKYFESILMGKLLT